MNKQISLRSEATWGRPYKTPRCQTELLTELDLEVDLSPSGHLLGSVTFNYR